jgi:hypothetical protein
MTSVAMLGVSRAFDQSWVDWPVDVGCNSESMRSVGWTKTTTTKRVVLKVAQVSLACPVGPMIAVRRLLIPPSVILAAP